jgi:hypothetical protein
VSLSHAFLFCFLRVFVCVCVCTLHGETRALDAHAQAFSPRMTLSVEEQLCTRRSTYAQLVAAVAARHSSAI